MSVRVGFRALIRVRSIKAVSRSVRRRPHRIDPRPSIVGQRRRGPTYSLDSDSHSSRPPMDISPAHIVCSNRPDTAG